VLALVWTALKQGPAGRPAVKKVVIVAPSSLCKNWAAEAKKWLGEERLKVHAGPLCSGFVMSVLVADKDR
jgi:DNA repair and recombination protein RAD54B